MAEVVLGFAALVFAHAHTRRNPAYGAERIAAMVSKQLEVPVSESTVRNVLSRHLGKAPPKKPSGQTWKTFLKNHREFLGSMDFKVTFDWRARPLFILSILSHHRRRLIHCRCTYHPTTEWVAQQMREAFPFDEGLRLPQPRRRHARRSVNLALRLAEDTFVAYCRAEFMKMRCRLAGKQSQN
jgi:hypothetical protein